MLTKVANLKVSNYSLLVKQAANNTLSKQNCAHSLTLIETAALLEE